jgi:hypothetical protein
MGNLHEVMKSGVNLDHQIHKDMWRRPRYFRGKVLWNERREKCEITPEGGVHSR